MQGIDTTTDFKFHNGIIEDPRPEIKKERDYKHEDIFTASTAPVIWEEKSRFKFFDKRNQASSLSCMAQSGVKMLGIEQGEFKTLSARGVYTSRTNVGGGMYQQECLSLLTKPLAPLESSLPSQNMGEFEINKSFIMSDKMKSEAEDHRATKYVIVSELKNIDKVASIVAQGKGVQLMMFFTDAEWWRPYPEVIDDTLTPFVERALRHGVCVVDYTLWNGKKALIIEDSAGNHTSLFGNGQRIITEDFFNARCYGIGYLSRDIPDDIIIPTLRKGAKGEMVKKLQRKLGGLTVDGIFGNKTLDAVKKYQKSHGLVADGIVGKNTATQLNADL